MKDDRIYFCRLFHIVRASIRVCHDGINLRLSIGRHRCTRVVSEKALTKAMQLFIEFVVNAHHCFRRISASGLNLYICVVYVVLQNNDRRTSSDETEQQHIKTHQKESSSKLKCVVMPLQQTFHF